MAKHKPIRIGDSVPLQQISASEEIDGKIYVTQTGVVLGRTSAGDGPHEEILFADLPGSGGGSYIEITYADMQTAITNSTLTPGGWYLITDASGTDLGFLTYAVTENQISVSGVGGYLNADFQAVGDYSNTPETFNSQLGIWRLGFELIEVAYQNINPADPTVSYSTSSGVLNDGEDYATDLGGSGIIIHDDGAGTLTLSPDAGQTLQAGEVITGDTSANTVTVESYTPNSFAIGQTLTGQTTGATLIITALGSGAVTGYMTSPGVTFDGSEVLDNGNGVTADQDGPASSPTIVQGDVVIWNLLHYQLTDLTLLDGSNPADNTSAYTLLDKATYPETYVTAWDVSEFDFANNWLQYRQDLRGNAVRYSYIFDQTALGLGYSGVLDFKFGSDNTYLNVVESSYVGIKNSLCLFRYNVLSNYSSINDISANESSEISFNTLALGTIARCVLGESVQMSYNNLGINSTISDINLGGGRMINNTLYQDSRISELTIESAAIETNILENGAQLTGITAGENCSISRNKVGQGATLGGSTTMGDGVEAIGNTLLSTAAISNMSIETNCAVRFNQLGNGASITSCVLVNEASISGTYLYDAAQIANKTLDGSNGGPIGAWTIGGGFILNITETISDYIRDLRVEGGFSNFKAQIDITGLSTLDYLFDNAFAGIVNLTSSNATENIDTITNPPTAFPFILRNAQTGLALTITGTALSGIGAGQIALKAASYVLNPGEYIVLDYDPATGALIENRVVNGLV